MQLASTCAIPSLRFGCCVCNRHFVLGSRTRNTHSVMCRPSSSPGTRGRGKRTCSQHHKCLHDYRSGPFRAPMPCAWALVELVATGLRGGKPSGGPLGSGETPRVAPATWLCRRDNTRLPQYAPWCGKPLVKSPGSSNPPFAPHGALWALETVRNVRVHACTHS